MELIPRLHKEIEVACDAPRLTAEVAAELPRHGIVVTHHFPGLRVLGHILRPTSMSLGQEVRVEVRAAEGGGSSVSIDSRYNYPGVDFTHQNQKNLDLLESVVMSAHQKCAA